VLPVRLPAERVARIRVVLHELPGATMPIDLAAQIVVGPTARQTGSRSIRSARSAS